MRPYVMVEYPAWRPTAEGVERIFVLPDESRWLVTLCGHDASYVHLYGAGSEPEPDIFTPLNGAPREVPELATALHALGPVARFRNFDLWDAIGTAIIRQVIRAGQAKKLYRAFCDTYGEQVVLPNGTQRALFPTVEIVLSLSDTQFAAIGMAFKRRPLRAAAEAYIEFGPKWRDLSPAALVADLQRVPRIGPWTASAAVADWSNDWALYPYGDLAVRTWAKRAAPSFPWPNDEAAFGEVWQALAADRLGPLTLLTLAWGSQHGDIG
jgi:DNA-3-methyladenine glycosylase II